MADNQATDTSSVLNADTLTPTPAKKPRGRPAGKNPGTKVDKKVETPQQRIDRLKTELLEAEHAKQEFEAKQAAIIGKAVIAHALANTDYRKQLAALLHKEVTSKGDIAIIDEFLT